MFRLALRTLHRRKGGFIASLIVLFFGALVVMACGGLMETGIRLTVPPERLAGAPLIVSANQAYTERIRLPDSLLPKLQKIAGVQQALPDISFAAALLRGNQPLNDARQLPGHGWSSAALAPYQLVSGHAPAQGDEVVIDQKLARQNGVQVGDMTRVAVQGSVGSFKVVGIADSPTAASEPALFFSDSEAGQVFGFPGKIDNIGIVPSPGTDFVALQTRINQAISGTNAKTLAGNSRGLAEFPNVAQDGSDLIAISAVFGGLAIMVAIFIVSSTLSLSVQQRRREMALLRAIGATRAQVRRMVLGETMVVSVIATALAYAPSTRFGEWLLSRFAAGGAFSSDLVYRQGWVPGVVGAGVALLAAVVAALFAALGATRVRPTEALVEASIQKRWLGGWRLACALLCLAGGAALFLVTALVMHGPIAASTAAPAAMLWAAGLALLGPGIAGVLIAVLQWPFRLFGGLGARLATLNLRLRKVRVSGVIVPVMLMSGLAVGLVYLQTSQTARGNAVYAQTLQADALIASSTGGVPLSFVQSVNQQSGVRGATALVTSGGFIDIPGGDPDEHGSAEPLLGVSTADHGFDNLRLAVTGGSLSQVTGNAVVLSTGQAAALNKKVGDQILLRFGDGVQAHLTVAATVNMAAGYDTIIMPASLLLQHTTSNLVPQIAVRAAPGVSAAQLANNLQEFANTQPGLHVAATNTAAGPAQEQTGALVSYLFVATIVGYTIVSLLNTVIVATMERQREFALERLIGATRAQVLRMVSAEAGVASLAGIVLGTLIAALTLVPFCIALKGSPTPNGPWWIYGVIVGGAIVLTLLTSLIASTVALRARPVDIAATRE